VTLTRASNDTLDLVAQTDFDGPVFEFDFSGLDIGCAEYAEGATGCTVFYFPAGASLESDIRGGSPGTLGSGYEWVDAICLAGGSLYGLEAVGGVAAELFARREYRTGWLDIPLVAGAIIFDYGPRDNAVYPDKELGRAGYGRRARVCSRSGCAARDDRRPSARRSASTGSSRPGRAPPSGGSARRGSRSSRS
jgi:hypothetical protein